MDQETQGNPMQDQPQSQGAYQVPPQYQSQPYQGQPYQGQPYQGQPYQGQPYQGQPYQGQPYQGQPYQGQPYQGQPYQGQPVIHIVNANTNTNTNTNTSSSDDDVVRKSKVVALLLCLFLGGIGAHHFYCGKVGMGILYLFTLGLFGIGALIDLIRIIVGSYSDKYGRRLV